MKKLADRIVDRRKSILIAFVVLTLACAVMIPFVEINYDMSAYLPADSDTIQGLNVMTDEFGAPGSMSVMVKNVSLSDASALRKALEAVENVDSVMFLDTLLLSMKTDEEQSDEAYIDEMFDLLNLVYKMQSEFFPDRSLGYVYDKMMSFTSEMDVGGGFSTDSGMLGGTGLLDSFALFGDGGQSMADIDGSSLDMLEGYYKQGAALLSVTLAYGDYDIRTQNAVAEISTISPRYGDAYFSGQAAAAYYNRKDSGEEMLFIGIIALVLIVAILFLTTTAWVEPLLYFGVIIVAIILNMGTNIFVGSVSSMTNTIAALLQLALSIDYSIFLLHAYNAEKKVTLDKTEAMKKALAKSLSPISASSLTTIASFVALMFMTFQIGLNFGLVLGKGILFSLITVFLLMPVFVTALDKPLERTQHRSLLAFFRDLNEKRRARRAALAVAAGMTPEKSKTKKTPLLHRYANVLYKLRFFVPAFFLILMLPMYFFQANNDFFFGEYQEGSTASTYLAHSAEVQKIFGRQNTGVILFANSLADKESELCDALDDFSFVISVTNFETMASTMDEESIPSELKAQFIGVNYTRIILSLDLPDEGAVSFAAVDKIEQTLADILGDDGDFYFLGGTKSIYEISAYSFADNTFISLLTLIFILIIIAVTFKSAGITVILGAIIQGATWMNMAIPFLMGNAMHFIGYLMVSGVQMGATIDYGILLTNNYMEARKIHGKQASIRYALSSSFASILTAGSILTTVGFAVGLVTSSITTEVMGMAIGRGAIISTVCMLFVLPQCLVLLDKVIMKTTWRGKTKMCPDVPEGKTENNDTPNTLDELPEPEIAAKADYDTPCDKNAQGESEC